MIMWCDMNKTEMMEYAYKGVATIAGAMIGILEPTIPFAVIIIFALILDSISAWRLARRVKKRYPKAKVHDKYESDKAWSMFPTLLFVYSIIVFAFLIDRMIFPFVEMYLPNMIAGAFCFYELWSILENESSENGKSWAKVLQKIMVNKANRHIDGMADALNEINKNDHGPENIDN